MRSLTGVLVVVVGLIALLRLFPWVAGFVMLVGLAAVLHLGATRHWSKGA